MNTASVSCRKPYSGDDKLVPVVSGGVFQTTNHTTGLNAPNTIADTAKVMSTTASDCRNVTFNPNNGASMPFNNPLPSVVNNITSGSLMPV